MADPADEPLMRHETEDAAVDVDLNDVSLLLEKNLRHPGLFVWLLTFSAGISGLLFGCKCLLLYRKDRDADLGRRYGRHFRNARLDQ